MKNAQSIMQILTNECNSKEKCLPLNTNNIKFLSYSNNNINNKIIVDISFNKSSEQLVY